MLLCGSELPHTVKLHQLHWFVSNIWVIRERLSGFQHVIRWQVAFSRCWNMSATTLKGPCDPDQNNRCELKDNQPHPAGVNAQHFLIFFPEDLWGWRSIDLAFQTHCITLQSSGVQQSLDKDGRLESFLGCVWKQYAAVNKQKRRRARSYLIILELWETIQTRPPELPMTLSLMVNRLSPALFLATHSYTPASCTVVISRMNECIPFSHTNILWNSSGRTALPSRYQVTSGMGRPPTWSGERRRSPWGDGTE